MAKQNAKTENTDVADRMIADLRENLTARDEQQELVDNAKSFLGEINMRIKNARQALSFMTDYLSKDQITALDDLDEIILSSSNSGQGNSLNEVAQKAMEILQDSEKGEMTNGDLYEAYLEEVGETGDEAVKYAAFNIKMRSLFASQKLIRHEPANAQNSKEHVIRINGFRTKK